MLVGTGNTRDIYVTDVGDEVTADISRADARRIAEGIPGRDFPAYVGQGNHSGFSWSSTTRRHVVYG